MADACLMLNGLSGQFLFAARLQVDAAPVSTQFWLPEPAFRHFDYLANVIIITMARSGAPPLSNATPLELITSCQPADHGRA